MCTNPHPDFDFHAHVTSVKRSVGGGRYIYLPPHWDNPNHDLIILPAIIPTLDRTPVQPNTRARGRVFYDEYTSL